MLCEMATDRDSRVRIVAAEGLIALVDNDVISLSAYIPSREVTTFLAVNIMLLVD